MDERLPVPEYLLKVPGQVGHGRVDRTFRDTQKNTNFPVAEMDVLFLQAGAVVKPSRAVKLTPLMEGLSRARIQFFLGEALVGVHFCKMTVSLKGVLVPSVEKVLSSVAYVDFKTFYKKRRDAQQGGVGVYLILIEKREVLAKTDQQLSSKGVTFSGIGYQGEGWTAHTGLGADVRFGAGSKLGAKIGRRSFRCDEDSVYVFHEDLMPVQRSNALRSGATEKTEAHRKIGFKGRTVVFIAFDNSTQLWIKLRNGITPILH